MAHTEFTHVFSFIGDLLYKGLRPVADKLIRFTEKRGDTIADRFSRSRRPTLALMGMGGGVTATIVGVYFSRNPPQRSLTGTEMDSIITPRLQTAMKQAMRYAANGNLSLMDENITSVNDILLEYPQFRSMVVLKFDSNNSNDTNANTNSDTKKIESIPSQTEIQSVHKDDNTKSEISADFEKLNKQKLMIRTADGTTEESILTPGKPLFTAKDLSQLLENSSAAEIIASIPTANDANSDTESQLSEFASALRIEDISQSEALSSEPTIEFVNQLDYIRHVGVRQRCRKLFLRAQRHAYRSQVQQCSTALAELWQLNNDSDYPITIDLKPNSDESGDDKRLVIIEDKHMFAVMDTAHRTYLNELLEDATMIGETAHHKLLMERQPQHETTHAHLLLTNVWNQLDRARNYAKRYHILDSDTVSEMKQIWQSKESKFAKHLRQPIDEFTVAAQ